MSGVVALGLIERVVTLVERAARSAVAIGRAFGWLKPAAQDKPEASGLKPSPLGNQTPSTRPPPGLRH